MRRIACFIVLLSALASAQSPVRPRMLVVIDNDLNASPTLALWETGHDNGQATRCFTPWAAAGSIFDLSGNAAEWTSSPVVAFSKTFFSIQGGSIVSTSNGSSPSDGTSCGTAVNLAPSTWVNPTVGFRCCSDAAP